MSNSTDADAPAPHARPATPGAAVPERASRIAILIVENNPSFRKFLQSALRARFPFVALATAEDVREALLRIDAARPDLVFTDVRLPDGYGFELTRSIRRMAINAKVVFLSTHDSPEYREEAYRSGADHYLAKGAVSMDDIVAFVLSAIAARHLR